MYSAVDPRAPARRASGVGYYSVTPYGGNQDQLGLPYSVVAGNVVQLAPLKGNSLQAATWNGLNGFPCSGCSRHAGLGAFSLADVGSGIGWLGYAAAGVLLYLILFRTGSAQRRRRELSEAKEEYRARVRKIKTTYPRIGLSRES